MQLLDIIQKDIDRLYGINTGFKASDFYKEEEPEERGGLFYIEEDDELGMAILLKKDITDNLARNNPMQDLHEENLYDFMTVVEEVDHFCYAANRAKRDRPFTLLEVEIQGSITRYLIAVKYMRRHGRLKFNNMAAMDGLFEMVFDAYEYKNDMHEFSYYVGLRFCRKLKNMLLDLNMKEFNRSLKDFYHYGLTDKICCALYRSRLCRT